MYSFSQYFGGGARGDWFILGSTFIFRAQAPTKSGRGPYWNRCLCSCESCENLHAHLAKIAIWCVSCSGGAKWLNSAPFWPAPAMRCTYICAIFMVYVTCWGVSKKATWRYTVKSTGSRPFWMQCRFLTISWPRTSTNSFRFHPIKFFCSKILRPVQWKVIRTMRLWLGGIKRISPWNRKLALHIPICSKFLMLE